MKRFLGILAGLVLMLGFVACVYGAAKVALAQNPKPPEVVVDLPGVQAVSPPDERGRQVGYQSLGIGGVALAVGLLGLIYSFRKTQPTRA